MNANVNVQFRIGEMVHYIATRSFALGSTGLTVAKGTDILFDGSTAEVDGQEYKSLSFLRGAVKAGWLVMAEDYDPDNPAYSQRPRANIQVRPAVGGDPTKPQPRMAIATAETDEREVGNVKVHAKQVADGNKNYVRGQTQVNAPVRTQHGMEVIEDQEGVVLPRSFQTPAGERAKERLDLTSARAAQALKVAQNAQVRPGEGITESEMLDRMDPDAREEYLAQKEALKAQYVPTANTNPTAALPRPSSRKVVARVQSKKSGQSEGVSFRNSVGGGTQIGDSDDGEIVGRVHAHEDTVESFEQEGIKFTGTNLKRPAVQPKTENSPVASHPATSINPDICRKVAKALCPDFPDDYKFELSPKKKLARLQADYEDRKDILQAVFAAESDEMKALLVQEFPEAFAS